MDPRKRMLLLVLAVAWAAGLGKSLLFASDARKALGMGLPEAQGMDGELLEMVNAMEARILERLEYQVGKGRDPLDLRRVVRIETIEPRGQEFREATGGMRLSGTIVSGEHSRAIVKFRGRSHILSEGDVFEGRIVKAIGDKTLVLSQGGREIVLHNQPAPQEEGEGQSHPGVVEELSL